MEESFAQGGVDQGVDNNTPYSSLKEVVLCVCCLVSVLGNMTKL